MKREIVNALQVFWLPPNVQKNAREVSLRGFNSNTEAFD